MAARKVKKEKPQTDLFAPADIATPGETEALKARKKADAAARKELQAQRVERVKAGDEAAIRAFDLAHPDLADK